MMRALKVVTSHFSSSHQQLSKLAEQSRQRQHMLAIIQVLLPAEVAPFCYACSLVNDGILTLYARTAAEATRLRLYSNSLVNELNRTQTLHQTVKKVRCKICPPDPIIHSARQHTQLPGHLLNELAQTMNDPDLGKILLRLAQRSAKER